MQVILMYCLLCVVSLLYTKHLLSNKHQVCAYGCELRKCFHKIAKIAFCKKSLLVENGYVYMHTTQPQKCNKVRQIGGSGQIIKWLCAHITAREGSGDFRIVPLVPGTRCNYSCSPIRLLKRCHVTATSGTIYTGTSSTIRKSSDPSSPCEGAGPPDYITARL